MMRWRWLAACVLLCTGCASGMYTFLGGRAQKVNEGALIGVAVLTPDSEGLTDFEGYLTAALLRAKYNVKTLRLDTCVPLECGRASEAAPAGPCCNSCMTCNAAPAAAPATAPVAGAAAAAAASKKEAPAAVPEKVYAKARGYGVEYLLFVHRFDTFGFASYLVDLSDGRVLNSFVVSGDRDGFRKAIKAPDGGKTEIGEDGDISRLELMRVAEFVAGSL